VSQDGTRDKAEHVSDAQQHRADAHLTPVGHAPGARREEIYVSRHSTAPTRHGRPNPLRLADARSRTVAGLVAAGMLATVALGLGSTAQAETNAVPDPSFEAGTSAWFVTTGAKLARVTPGYTGSFAARVTNTTTKNLTVALNDKVNTVAKTVKGQRYTATAWIRPSAAKQSVAIRLMEYAGSSYKGQALGKAYLTSTSWRKLTVTYTAVTDGASLDLNIVNWQMKPSAYFEVDEVALPLPAAAVAAPAPAPTTEKPSPAATTQEPTTDPTTQAPSEPAAPTTSAPQSSTPAPDPTTPKADPTTPAPDGWQLSFSDEFNGTAVDASKWNVRNNTSLSYEESYLLARNVTVDNGVLSVAAKRETVGAKNYTSGYLDSIGKFSQRYGLWKVRAKLNTPIGTSQGMWPCPLWLRGDTSPMEIDVVEGWGTGATPINGYRPGSASASIHQNTMGGGGKVGGWLSPAGVDLSADFHVYEVEWAPDFIAVRVDGVEKVRATPANAPWAFSGPDYDGKANMRLNLQVAKDGSYYGGVDADTAFPSTLQVDYIRVYTK
jgi:beta-glucanase (GH16 family)